MKVLGIDPGYGCLGWSVVGNDLSLIDYGSLETAAGADLADRILMIHEGLDDIIRKHRPALAAIERLFFNRNSTTAMDVAKTIGAVLLTLRLHGISYAEYTPSQVKQSVTGYGRAGKDQMQLMIMKIFRLAQPPEPDDAADAIAIALCHTLRCGSRAPSR